MKPDLQASDIVWLYPLKRRIVAGLFLLLAAAMAAAMLLTVVLLKNNLTKDSVAKTQELGMCVTSSLKGLMLMRAPGMIQASLDEVSKGEGGIVRAFIIDKTGKIAYSTDKGSIGRTIDRKTEAACRACHNSNRPPESTTVMLNVDGIDIHRNVRVIYNGPSCHECHPPEQKINGKLIIDRSLSGTKSLINGVIFIIFGSGLACLAITLPLINRGVDKFIGMILRQNAELNMLYAIVDRLSKTIDFEELKTIVVEIIRDTAGADEVEMIIPRHGGGHSSFLWKAGMPELMRHKIEDDSPLLPVILKWLASKAGGEDAFEQSGIIYMGIRSKDAPLALFAVRKSNGGMGDKLRLLRAISSHIAIAFENARLYSMAITDELSGLYTYRHFKYYINRVFSEFEKYGKSVTLLMLDIDDFKSINDTYGHPVGDTVIKKIAAVILSSLRESKDVAFRYGGEEFCVLLDSTDRNAGATVARRIRAAIENETFEHGDLRLKATVSIGVSNCPAVAQNAKDLIVSADNALYSAKRQGKNRFVIAGCE